MSLHSSLSCPTLRDRAALLWLRIRSLQRGCVTAFTLPLPTEMTAGVDVAFWVSSRFFMNVFVSRMCLSRKSVGDCFSFFYDLMLYVPT